MQHLLRVSARPGWNTLRSSLLLVMSIQMATPPLKLPRVPRLQGSYPGGKTGASFGRGKTRTDPLIEVLSWDGPSSRTERTEMASAPLPGVHPCPNFGFMPLAYVGMENFAISTAFGGHIPALFIVQFHGFRDSTVHGTTSGYPFGFNGLQNGGLGRNSQQTGTGETDDILKNLFMMIGVFVILALICWKIDSLISKFNDRNTEA